MNIKTKLLKLLPDKLFLTIKYYQVFHKKINWKNPKSFNEKLQWLKLYDRQGIYCDCVDKFEAKKYVSNIIGKQYIIPTLGVWDSFDEIDFEKLPKSFVLKCTHDCGGVAIISDKTSINKKDLKKQFNDKLNENYFYTGREWPYKNIKPRIIAEVMLDYDNEGELKDYKLQCFNGKFDNVLVCTGRHSKNGVRYYYFDRYWNYLPYSDYGEINTDDFGKFKPKNFDKMVELAEMLAKEFVEIRVDFYNVDGKIYFGELTFFSGDGFDTTITHNADLILGERLQLMKRNMV